MPFNDEECILEPQKNALHIWNAALGRWDEWTGAIVAGDIEIGAVEIKNATSDVRAIVTASGKVEVHAGEDATVVIATGNAAVAMPVNPTVAFKLERVDIHLNAVGASGTLTITKDAGAGAAYDTVLLSQDMTAVTDIVWQPTRPMKFQATDHIDIVWANAGGKTYGIEAIWSLA